MSGKNHEGFVKKGDELYLALLAYRPTPLSNGYSPTELLLKGSLERKCLAQEKLRNRMSREEASTSKSSGAETETKSNF